MNTARQLEPGELEWTFGDRVRKARDLAGIDQGTLAEAISELLDKPIGQGAVSNWEHGSQPRNLIKVADAIAQVTGVPAAWILGFSNPKLRTRPNHLTVVAMPTGQQQFSFETPVTLTAICLDQPPA